MNGRSNSPRLIDNAPMPATLVRLTEPTLLAADTQQNKSEAVDAAGFNTVVVQLNTHITATTAAVQMQHAAVLVENQFEDIGATLSLTASGPHTVVITGHTRYIRWSTIAGGTGNPVGSIDLVLRS